MKIGIIGLGCVGTAVKKGLESIGHEIVVHDLKLITSIDSCLKTEVIFICLPTPNTSDKICDTTEIEKTLKNLESKNYKGIIAIKSTVYPNFTKIMQERFPYLEICFVPEFLREKTALDDFLHQKLLLVGTQKTQVFRTIKSLHKDLSENTMQLCPTECEIMKYMTNAIAATRIVFANIFYELSKNLDVDYSKIKNALIKTEKINDLYLDVNSSLRGYSGSCLPKDIETLSCILKKNNLDFDFIDSIIKDNKKFG